MTKAISENVNIKKTLENTEFSRVFLNLLFCSKFWENFKPHKIRLYKIFVCYKCVTKNYFYLFLNTYRYFLFLCSSIISTCLSCFSSLGL